METNQYRIDYPVELIKSEDSAKDKINIRIIASSPVPDREDDLITLKAFSDKTKEDYLKNSPVIDYNHNSIRGENEIIKAQARIGVAMNLSIQDNKPVIEGFLFPKNIIVSTAIAPSLEFPEGQRLWKASLGGSIVKSERFFSKEHNKNINKIEEISINHVAICPAHTAINQSTSIEVIKSSLDNNTYFEKSGADNTLVFNGFQSFAKAMTTGYATDINNISGGQALQPQSLEGGNIDLIGLLGKTIQYILIAGNNLDTQSMKQFLYGEGLSDDKADKFISFIVRNKNEIKNLMFN